MKYIRDPLYGEITIPDEFLEIVDHPLFQRLRRVKQLALVNIVFPSANHTRFEHSLGVFHVASWLSDEKIRLYALLHDVGHGPFSHLLERALRENGIAFDHDKRLKELAKEILQDSVFSPSDLPRGDEKLFVDGDLGADRLDYLRRDSYHIGVGLGNVAWDRLIRLIKVEEGKTIIPEKALTNAEHVFLARFWMGDSVYLHKTVVILDYMFIRAVSELLEHFSWREIVKWDDYEMVARLREFSRWWKLIEERKPFKIVFRGGEQEAAETYEKLSAEFGTENVILGKRGSIYKKISVYLEDGRHIFQASPLVRSLKRAEEKRHYWFVAVNPVLRKEAEEIVKREGEKQERRPNT